MDALKKGILIMVLALAGFACNKSSSCYDAELAKANETVLCTQDCPGFKGCDGNNYCNECIAAGHGIGPK
jgi:hypothetical protein